MALKIEYYVARMNQKYGSCITEIGGWEWPIQP